MGDGRWEDGAHSLDQLSSGAMLEDEEEPQTEAVEVVAAAAASAAAAIPASILLLSQVSGLYPRRREPKEYDG